MTKLSIAFIEKEILPWARENHPTKDAQSLGVEGRPRAYRLYMQRLVEIRYAEDPGWDPPLRLLEETKIKASFMMPDGEVFEVSGRACRGLRRMSWDGLATIIENDTPLSPLRAAMDHLDLYVADTDREWPEASERPQATKPVSAPEPPKRKRRTRYDLNQETML